MPPTIISFLVFHFFSPKVYLTFIKAVVIILKHATLLRRSNLPSKSALTQAELEYQVANIDMKIHQHLMVSSQVQPIEQFSDFIMTTDIGWFIPPSFSILLPLIKPLVPSQSLAQSHTPAHDAV